MSILFEKLCEFKSKMIIIVILHVKQYLVYKARKKLRENNGTKISVSRPFLCLVGKKGNKRSTHSVSLIFI